MSKTAVEWLARFGYAARGLVYLVVGGLAVLAALGRGGRTTGSRGALSELLSTPYGGVILGVVALGLFCFAMWRLAQAFLDADDLGRDAKSLVRRAAFVVSALANLGLALSAVRLIFSLSESGGDDSSRAQDWTATILGLPLGQWIVALLGLGVVAAGIATGLKGWKAKFEKHLALDDRADRWVLPVGRAGYLARGFVFLIAGGFLILAAYQANAREVRGLSGSLRALQEQPYGWLLLLVTALGLFAFGAYQGLAAYYRRIDAPDLEDAADRAEREVRSAVG